MRTRATGVAAIVVDLGVAGVVAIRAAHTAVGEAVGAGATTIPVVAGVATRIRATIVAAANLPVTAIVEIVETVAEVAARQAAMMAADAVVMPAAGPSRPANHKRKWATYIAMTT